MMDALFAITVPPWQLIARGTMVYVGLILVIRFVLRRDIGALSTPDLLFIVLVADASQNAMAADYKTVADGAVLVGTLIFWNVALDWLAYRFQAIRFLTEPPPEPLVVNGRLIRRNLRKEWITEDELNAKLREHGVTDLEVVRRATLEADGELSVIRRDDSEPQRPRRRQASGGR